MSAPLLLDLSHTSHTRARTGIQRVTRALHSTLGEHARSIAFDPYSRQWRNLQRWEITNLSATGAAAGKRGAKWPLHAKLRGQLAGWSARKKTVGDRDLLAGKIHASFPRTNSGLLVPEIFSPGVAAALPALFAATQGPRVAIFHDAIALKFPELTPTKTVARFPGYLRELLMFDGIAAISEDSRQSLVDFWRWLGISSTPVVQTIPLGIDAIPSAAFSKTSPTPPARPVVLSVGSIEGRKNHFALLEACEILWAEGATFELHLIGLAHPQTGRRAIELIEQLQKAGRSLRYDGPVSDARLETAYHECMFTVYPSLMEGFGLPVLESLARGKPCICSARGALGESARGGGCIALPHVDAASLAAAMNVLLTSAPERRALTTAAVRREFRSWNTYTEELTSWMKTLPRRESV